MKIVGCGEISFYTILYLAEYKLLEKRIKNAISGAVFCLFLLCVPQILLTVKPKHEPIFPCICNSPPQWYDRKVILKKSNKKRGAFLGVEIAFLDA